MMLSAAISILASKAFCSMYCDYAEQILGKFVDHLGAVYGDYNLIYNVHTLTHLASQCRLFGPLHGFCGFPFENHLQMIKRLIRKPKSPLQQVIRRIAEQNHVTRPIRQDETYCKRQHNRGPIAHNFGICTQYEQFHSPVCVLTTAQPDNVILVGGDTYVIKNIIIHEGLTKIICCKFAVKDYFFDYPFDSRIIDIYLVSHEGQRLCTFESSEIKAKVVLLPYKDEFVSIPMIEST